MDERQEPVEEEKTADQEGPECARYCCMALLILFPPYWLYRLVRGIYLSISYEEEDESHESTGKSDRPEEWVETKDHPSNGPVENDGDHPSDGQNDQWVSPPPYKVIGIENHGSTCFASSMLQAINQTEELHYLYVLRNYRKLYLTPSNSESVLVVAEPSKVSEALKELFCQFKNNAYVDPQHLLKQLGSRHPRFIQGSQEDSHEALRSLLDDIKTEEIEKVKKEIRSQFNVTGNPRSQERLSKEEKAELKGYLRSASKVPVAVGEAVGGATISTTICHVCHNVLQNTEPFFDISLPIPISSANNKAATYQHLPPMLGNEIDQCAVDILDHSTLYVSKRKRSSDHLPNYTSSKRHKDLSTVPKNVPHSEYKQLSTPASSQHTFNYSSSTLEESKMLASKKNLSHNMIVKDKAAFQNHLESNHFKYQNKSINQGKHLTDLEHSLMMYTDLDVLDEDNKFICAKCTESNKSARPDASDDEVLALCQVSKQIMIHQLPPVLILHIKRFKIGPYSVTKDSKYVSFPPILDVAPYCTTDCLEEWGDSSSKILYGLYAVVVHHGSTLHSGHYVAYVKSRPAKKGRAHHGDDQSKGNYDEAFCDKGQWHYTSDTHVHECQFSDVQKNKAYILFYELLPKV
ncbi:ubiquitin carboxyl-terminal hydrolase 16-like isoform X2 [Dysidea avara]|uniref:ubiquitin carboxyl-terminal hydrolase 16-like isoform X2 n=1 Tax=Dysidea avara TaxID=196820 RepID=UPI003322EA17